jgi:hypothetical protein
MRQRRSVSLALRHLRVEQGDAAFSRRRERVVAEGRLKPAHCWIVALAQAAFQKMTGRPARRATNQNRKTCKCLIVHRRLFARRRAGHCDSDTIARELHAAPNIIPAASRQTGSQQALLEHSRRARQQSELKGGAPEVHWRGPTSARRAPR